MVIGQEERNFELFLRFDWGYTKKGEEFDQKKSSITKVFEWWLKGWKYSVHEEENGMVQLRGSWPNFWGAKWENF